MFGFGCEDHRLVLSRAPRDVRALAPRILPIARLLDSGGLRVELRFEVTEREHVDCCHEAHADGGESHEAERAARHFSRRACHVGKEDDRTAAEHQERNWYPDGEPGTVGTGNRGEVVLEDDLVEAADARLIVVLGDQGPHDEAQVPIEKILTAALRVEPVRLSSGKACSRQVAAARCRRRSGRRSRRRRCRRSRRHRRARRPPNPPPARRPPNPPPPRRPPRGIKHGWLFQRVSFCSMVSGYLYEYFSRILQLNSDVHPCTSRVDEVDGATPRAL